MTMAKYRIAAPMLGFTGVSAGVNFTNGVAEIEAPVLPLLAAGVELDRDARRERETIAQDENLRRVAYFRAQGYGIEELDEPQPPPADDEGDRPFDPSENGVDEVLEYLDSVADDEDEQARVIAAERDGKNRKTITEKGAAS